MKIPSISLNSIIGETKKTLLRFPLAVISAFAATISSLIFIHKGISFLPNLISILILGFFLFISISLFAEQRNWPGVQNILLLSVLGVALLAIYFLALPKTSLFQIENIHKIRFICWISCLVLLISFVPFLFNKEYSSEAFWRYNEILCNSVGRTVFYTVAIYAGLSIALASIDFLFAVEFVRGRYGELWIILSVFFAPLFFLARLPHDPLRKSDEYSRELRISTQYVLVPLTTIYFVILYAYSGKIIVTGNWPQSTVCYLISGFSLVGMFSYFFLYPLTTKERWAKIFSRVFCVALIPQVFILFWSLWLRISDYGITEKRYLTAAFGLWLLGIAVYFLVSEKKDISRIPMSLFLIAFFTSFGPWGIFSVSENNQINRLENILKKDRILVNDKVRISDTELDFKDQKEISAIVSYLYDYHGFEGIQTWFSQDLKKHERKSNRSYIYDEDYPPRQLVKLMGVEYVERWRTKPKEDSESSVTDPDSLNDTEYSVQTPDFLNVSEYDYLIPINLTYSSCDPQTTLDMHGDNYRIKIDAMKLQLLVFENEKTLADLSLRELVENLPDQESKNVDPDKMILIHEDNNIRLKVLFSYLRVNKESLTNPEISSLRGWVFFAGKSK